MVLLPEKDWSYRPKTLACRKSSALTSNLWWVPSVSPGEVIRIFILIHLFLYQKKRAKIVLMDAKMNGA